MHFSNTLRRSRAEMGDLKRAISDHRDGRRRLGTRDMDAIRDTLDRNIDRAHLVATALQVEGVAGAARADLAARQLRDRATQAITPDDRDAVGEQERRHPIIGGSRPAWMPPRPHWMP